MDTKLKQIIEYIHGTTLVDYDRQESIYRNLLNVQHLSGEIAELGVYKGGTAYTIASCCELKPIHLFDTFAGMPMDDIFQEGHHCGDFNDTSLEVVKLFLQKFPNIHYHPGLFPDTAIGLENKSFCFVHLDADIYQSTKAGIEFFYPRLVTGGCLIFDDYEWKNCPGVKTAIDEYFHSKNIIFKQEARSQATIIKNE